MAPRGGRGWPGRGVPARAAVPAPCAAAVEPVAHDGVARRGGPGRRGAQPAPHGAGPPRPSGAHGPAPPGGDVRTARSGCCGAGVAGARCAAPAGTARAHRGPAQSARARARVSGDRRGAQRRCALRPLPHPALRPHPAGAARARAAPGAPAPRRLPVHVGDRRPRPRPATPGDGHPPRRPCRGRRSTRLPGQAPLRACRCARGARLARRGSPGASRGPAHVLRR